MTEQERLLDDVVKKCGLEGLKEGLEKASQTLETATSVCNDEWIKNSMNKDRRCEVLITGRGGGKTHWLEKE